MDLARVADGQGQTPIARAKTRASEALLLQCSHLWDAGAAGTQSTVLSVTSWDAGALGTQVTVLCATRWDVGLLGNSPRSLVRHHVGPAALVGDGDCP